ncbi:MAG: hypothetical protein U0822_09420 [Anaerolineae bacterium]
MSKTKLFTLAASVALLVALFAAVAGPGAAFAQGPTPTTPTTPTNTMDQTFWQSLASHLGITLDRLTQAVKDAAKEAVASAVQNNRLTQSQADAIDQRVDQWAPGQGLPFGRGGRGPGGPGGPGGFGPGDHGIGGPAVLDAVAKALNLTTADLQTQLRSGKTLADLATSQNVSQDTVKQAIVTAQKAEIDQAQQAGRITADQATQMKQRIDQEAANLDLTKPFGGRGFGPGGPQGFAPGAGKAQGGQGGFGMMGGPAVLDAAAKALNLTTADLQTQLQSGKTLADIAQSKGVSQDTVKQAMVSAEKAQVDQAQQAGRITADQATQMKQRIDQNAANLDLTKPFGGRGFGPGAMPGMPGGRGGRGAPGTAPQGTPTTPQAPGA